jgi:ribonuclease VapC
MILDTSAIVAILRREPEADACLRVLESAPELRMSAGNLLEALLVVDNSKIPALPGRLDEFLLDHAITIEPVTESQARLARIAHQQYGRGNDSKAKLNYGDCFAYALARERGEPLLFVGEDFTHTDIRPALTT